MDLNGRPRLARTPLRSGHLLGGSRVHQALFTGAAVPVWCHGTVLRLAQVPCGLPRRAALRLMHSYAFGAAQEAGYVHYTCTPYVQPTSRLCVNTVQCSLISLSRDLTTSGCFEGLPASFEATASNPAAASRPPGDAVAPSARTETNHIFVDDVSNSATGSFRVKEGVNAGIKRKIS